MIRVKEYSGMLCTFCHKKINPIRRLWDRDFCCRAHRVVFEQAKFTDGIVYSARLLRQIEQGEDEFLEDEDRKKKQKQLPLSAVLVLMLAFVLLFLALPRQAPAPVSGAMEYALTQTGNRFPMLRKFRLTVPSVTLRESFHKGLKEWRPADSRSISTAVGDWVYRNGSVRPGRLRLWAPSLELTDYNFGFEAQIEKRGIGWAFRASNRDNYYGARVEVIRPGIDPVTSVVHYAMVKGRQIDRTALPIPLGIIRNEQYQVSMRIRGDKFVTSINGKVVDTWRDDRLRSGGVGFFAEKGDIASIHSVSVSTERGLLDRLFSSFILLPPASMTARW